MDLICYTHRDRLGAIALYLGAPIDDQFARLGSCSPGYSRGSIQHMADPTTLISVGYDGRMMYTDVRDQFTQLLSRYRGGIRSDPESGN